MQAYSQIIGTRTQTLIQVSNDYIRNFGTLALVLNQWLRTEIFNPKYRILITLGTGDRAWQQNSALYIVLNIAYRGQPWKDNQNIIMKEKMKKTEILSSILYS